MLQLSAAHIATGRASNPQSRYPSFDPILVPARYLITFTQPDYHYIS